MTTRFLWLTAALACAALGQLGCASASREATASAAPSDYTVVSNWVNLPSAPSKEVDVFYVFPTVYKAGPTDPHLAPIDLPTVVAGAKIAFGLQATAFAATANLYAPCYRQADLAYALSLAPAERDAFIGGIPTLDVTAAFDYYVSHYNQGRPFILAGHSQGSAILLDLLSGYMKDHPALYNRMVAAYVIGYSVTDAYLTANPHLKFAQGPGDTGVIISYNTQASLIAAPNPVVMPGALAINPISWTREETTASAMDSLGAMLPGPGGTLVPVPNLADATVNRAKGVVVCASPAVAGLPQSTSFPAGVYHPYDYNLYYNDLAANAALRIQRFLGR